MAMGYDSLSMSATNLLKVKSVLRGISQAEAQELLSKVLDLCEIADIHSAIDDLLEAKGITRLFGERIKRRHLNS